MISSPIAITTRAISAFVFSALWGFWGYNDLVPSADIENPEVERGFRAKVEMPSGAQVWRKWNKVYVRTGPQRGVTMLVIEKLYHTDGQNMQWTAVDGFR